MSISDVLKELDAIDEGSNDVEGRIYVKIDSKDLRRSLERLGHKIDNMKTSFEYIGEKILEVFIQHFFDEEGPDQAGRMKKWDDYHVNPDTGRQEHLERKRRSSPPIDEKLLIGEDNSFLPALERGGPNNIFKVSNNPRKLEVGVDIGHAILHNVGYTVKGKGGRVFYTESQMQRPFIGLTEDEENEIISEFEKEFFSGTDVE